MAAERGNGIDEEETQPEEDRQTPETPPACGVGLLVVLVGMNFASTFRRESRAA